MKIIKILNKFHYLRKIDRQLISAVINNDAAGVRDALKSGAYVEAKQFIQSGHRHDFDKKRPIHIAAMKGYLDIVKILHEAGANIDIQKSENFGPLHVAIHNNDIAMFDLLISLGANIEQKCYRQRTALDYAAYAGAEAIGLRLLQLGADIHAKNDLNQEPLLMATLRCLPKLAAALLKAGADPLHKNKNGEAPYDVVKTYSYAAMNKVYEAYFAQKHYEELTSMMTETTTNTRIQTL